MVIRKSEIGRRKRASHVFLRTCLAPGFRQPGPFFKKSMREFACFALCGAENKPVSKYCLRQGKICQDRLGKTQQKLWKGDAICLCPHAPRAALVNRRREECRRRGGPHPTELGEIHRIVEDQLCARNGRYLKQFAPVPSLSWHIAVPYTALPELRKLRWKLAALFFVAHLLVGLNATERLRRPVPVVNNGRFAVVTNINRLIRHMRVHQHPACRRRRRRRRF